MDKEEENRMVTPLKTMTAVDRGDPTHPHPHCLLLSHNWPYTSVCLVRQVYFDLRSRHALIESDSGHRDELFSEGRQKKKKIGH